MRVRKKPVEVEAVRYEAYGTNEDEVIQFLDGCTGWHMTEDGIVIPTLEGDMVARYWDYIIKGVNGEFYPCKPDIFDKTYEVLE